MPAVPFVLDSFASCIRGWAWAAVDVLRPYVCGEGQRGWQVYGAGIVCQMEGDLLSSKLHLYRSPLTEGKCMLFFPAPSVMSVVPLGLSCHSG